MIINESDQINEQKEVKIKMKNIENLIAKQNKSYLEKFLNLKNGSSAALAELVNLNDSSMSKRGKINSQASLHHLYQSSSHLINQANLIQPPPNNPQQQRRRSSVFKSTEVIRLRNTRINQGALQGINMFHRKYQNGFVDVWWLYDDGGSSQSQIHSIFNLSIYYTQNRFDYSIALFVDETKILAKV